MANLALIITAVHLAALGQVESGDNDRVVGRAGEVSRYQVMPDDWRREARLLGRQALGHTPNPRQSGDASVIAQNLWQNRVDTFRLAYQRNPTLAELYLCWHRPGRVLAPKPVEAERAQRFANLVGRLEGEAAAIGTRRP